MIQMGPMAALLGSMIPKVLFRQQPDFRGRDFLFGTLCWRRQGGHGSVWVPETRGGSSIGAGILPASLPE